MAITPPSTCDVSGYIYDAKGSALEGVTVKANLEMTSIYNSELQISQQKIETSTDSAGLWTLALIETENMDPEIKYKFEFKGFDYDDVAYRSVPDQSTANYADLT